MKLVTLIILIAIASNLCTKFSMAQNFGNRNNLTDEEEREFYSYYDENKENYLSQMYYQHNLGHASVYLETHDGRWIMVDKTGKGVRAKLKKKSFVFHQNENTTKFRLRFSPTIGDLYSAIKEEDQKYALFISNCYNFADKIIEKLHGENPNYRKSKCILPGKKKRSRR
jgi:hypothetical protein